MIYLLDQIVFTIILILVAKWYYTNKIKPKNTKIQFENKV